MQINPGTSSVSHPDKLENAKDTQLMEAAKQLEASFLAEMLKSSGLAETPNAFGGGTGEGQFSSFLIQARAEQMVEAGGIGLAEQLFETLKERE
jgi:Rod binding domain-containing protein